MISSMDGQTPASLGERLCRARMALGLTQEQLGAVVHVTDATINRYEKNVHRPDPDMLRRLADALGVSADYLLGRTNDRGASLVREPDPELIIIHGARELTDDDRADLVSYGEWLKERRRQRLKAGKPTPGRE